MNDPQALYEAINTETSEVLVGYDDVMKKITIAILTNGHILLEGVPGVAKTTAARLFARVNDLQYQRVQMTPDVLPADITGTHIYRDETGEFDLRRGPVFTNVLLADEINRATPKTQSALLESMREQTVTIEGETLEIPRPFLVIATQNPVEYEGTYSLPQAQRDRFLFKIIMDIPERSVERQVLNRFTHRPNFGPQDIESTIDASTVESAREIVREVHVEDRVYEYLLNIIEATRSHQATEFGASPRASLAYLHAAQARAAIAGREYVIPEDLQALAEDVLNHRIILDTDADLSGQTPGDVIEDVLDTADLPEESLSIEVPGE
jgi:MoxR-like ATPases